MEWWCFSRTVRVCRSESVLERLVRQGVAEKVKTLRVENRYWGSKRPEGKRPHGNLGEGHSTREQQVQPGVLWMGRCWCRGAQGSSRGRLRGSTGHRKDPRLYSEWACPQDSWGPWQECQRRSRYYVSEHLEAINQATIKKSSSLLLWGTYTENC